MVESSKALYLDFNQDQGCFACGTEAGFNIYNTIPYEDAFRRNLGGGVGIIEMLNRTNILALVGGGASPKFPKNKVMIWDDHQSKCIGELSFKTDVRGVKLRKDRVIVVLDARIYVYQFSDLKLLDALDTCANPRGLVAVSPKEANIIVCPDKKKGHVKCVNYDTNTNFERRAHESGLAALSITHDGKIIATASEKGTLIRLFSTADGNQIQEMRRGADKADIHCLSFDKIGKWLACSSDKGTVHVFALAAGEKVDPKAAIADADSPPPSKAESSPKAEKEEKKTAAKNPKSAFKFMKGIFSYFSSEWSFAQFRIADARSLVAFGKEESGKGSLAVITYDGKYYLAEFDLASGGECHKIVEKNIFDSKAEGAK